MTSDFRFFDVLRSQVIILEQNVLVMNKSQAEKKVYVFHAVFRVDVNDVKPFPNPTETSPFYHFLHPQSMPRLFKTINPWLIQTLLLFTLFQQFSTGVRLVTHIPKYYVIDNYVEPAVI